MKAIGLIRVSTAVQDLTQQTDAVKAAMLKDGYEEEDLIFIKDKESAVKLSEIDRLGLNKMKDYIEKDPSINCVYVFEISRLSRRPEVLYSVRDYLLSHKIQLIVLKPYMRLFEDNGQLSPSGSIMFGIFGAMAEQEGYIRKERMARGKRKAQLEGKSLGNWLPLGYTTDAERHIIIDEEKSKLVKKIFNMCIYENKSTVTIARELSDTGEFPTKTSIRAHSSSILNILRNTAYIGKAPYNQKRQKENYNQYPPIISEEDFNKAQELLSSRKKLPKTEHKNIYYCKGLIHDANSGYVLRASSCVASYCYASDRNDSVKYPSVTVPINLFDSFAWHLTKKYITNTDTTKMKEAKKQLEIRQKELERKIDSCTKKLDELLVRIERIQNRIISGKLSEALGDKMLDDIYGQSDELKFASSEFSREYHLNRYRLNTFESGELTKEALESSTDQEKYSLIHEVITKIIVEKGGVPEEGRIRKRGLGVKYGRMEVHYENEVVEQYKYNSYTKKCFTMDDIEVPYEYELRIKGQQHQPGYSIKNKMYKDRKKVEKLP